MTRTADPGRRRDGQRCFTGLPTREALFRGRGINKPNRIFEYRKTFNDRLKRACGKAGISPITLHGLRHIFAVRCVQANVNLKKLSKILGHASVVQTEIYADHSPVEMAAEGIDQLEAHERATSSAIDSGSKSGDQTR